MRIVRILEPTLASYLKEYITKGVEGFKELKWSGVKNELKQYKELIDKYFEKSPPKTINEAKSDRRVVLFIDATHFGFAIFLVFLWCRSRIFLKSHTGRKRHNVL